MPKARLRTRALVPVLVVAVVALIGAAAARPARAATLEERFEHTYPLQPGGTFALDNVNGDVAVSPWDRPEVRVTAVKRAKAGSEARAKELLAALEIRVTPSPNEVEVRTHFPNRGGGLFDWLSGGGSETSVTYRVDVPRSVRLRIDTVNGAIVARGTAGGAQLKTVNGALRATDVRGPLEVESVNGAIDVVGAAAGVRANTTNGEIDVRLTAVAAGDATRIATTNGGVTVHLPAAARASLDARTVNGEVESPLPRIAKGHGSRHLLGDLNGGGGRIEISTTNGGIRILQGA